MVHDIESATGKMFLSSSVIFCLFTPLTDRDKWKYKKKRKRKNALRYCLF